MAVLAGELQADIVAQSDFQDGTDDNWEQTFDPDAVSVAANAGPLGSGDFAALAIPNPNNGFMFPFQATNAGFVGNYLTSGAIQVQFDYRATGTLASGIELYVVMLNDPGNRWVSLANVVPTTNWQTSTISIAEPDIIRVLGSNSYATDFATISQIGFRFQSTANQTGGSNVGSTSYNLFLDNIQLQSIPEPTAMLSLFLATLLGCLRRKRVME
jgi:hypothetical protein